MLQKRSTSKAIWASLNLKTEKTGSGGGEFDVQCGKSTDMSVIDTLGFQFKEPPQNVKKTIAEVKLMAPRQQVALIEVRVYHVKAGTKMVDVRGSNSETQTCCVQDTTGSIDVKLWEDQIGMLQSGHCYQVGAKMSRPETLFFSLETEDVDKHSGEPKPKRVPLPENNTPTPDQRQSSREKTENISRYSGSPEPKGHLPLRNNGLPPVQQTP
ncbi:hypothetical protein E1301_Tti021721 [Triplophysa tibetana]|uniref:Uncharacterized protein n=1 Tax=Triplophysa tibetana TaxID=1572043 RepID=A0A5A9NBD7_9TELE|nr:hypothetical protein E1301_Tti021721 [Triplophysa tibetana]